MAVSNDQALRAVQAALRRAQEIGIKATAAVVDDAGALVVLARMDGALPITADIARSMAYTSASFGMPGSDMESWYNEPWFHSMVLQTNGQLLPAGGGLPITEGGALIGAIGVSGGSHDQDRDCSQAGIRALGL